MLIACLVGVILSVAAGGSHLTFGGIGVGDLRKYISVSTGGIHICIPTYVRIKCKYTHKYTFFSAWLTQKMKPLGSFFLSQPGGVGPSAIN
jgi:hypothetical protein